MPSRITCWRDGNSFSRVWRILIASAWVFGGVAIAAPASLVGGTNQNWGSAEPADRASVIAQTMIPYTGPSLRGTDVSTLNGKVMCGYQGWFTAPGDGSGRGWTHWVGKDGFKPGSCRIDLWPDVSELDSDERYATPFVHRGGAPADVFSSFNRKTVLRHFQWMQQYQIDGAFVQRFVVELSHPKNLRHANVVLNHCREGANLHGRAYAVMYDLSGMGGGEMNRVMDDWKLLVDQMQVTWDPAYLHHRGKPVVSIWGFGFNDHRAYKVSEGLELVRFLKNDPRYGGCTVMLGVPTHWRTLDRDCVSDPVLHELIGLADIVSPWTVGRYSSPDQARAYATNTMSGDLAWCRERQKDFLPVVFPGFSWHNMNPQSPLNQIPRRKGEFLWTQFAEAKKAGASMIYQAMFDEVDEGTAIFKCTDDPPIGASQFVTMEGLPSDHYLKLVGRAARMIRGEPAEDWSSVKNTISK